ncbi:hypothetical protein [Falsihalocynthiibacter arcticus]|uniref:Arc-like DNA binding domain-containing protein n=1 Tax=Falsihalocynthiibacter arcticus TaxID=1579316 RepID=A0A126V6A3_9RHOB|nr:hypothetical protein [Falsihalocynthiibacter arcticus]AML53812.1 hypothetical protein RC74_21405 [Falsihalocynthiibacter arcticus]
MTKISDEEAVHLQFRVPQSRADEFMKLVFENSRMQHGGKTKMFLLLIDEFQKSQQIKQLRGEIARIEGE